MQAPAAASAGLQAELDTLRAVHAKCERDVSALQTKNDELLAKVEKLESDVLFQQKRYVSMLPL